MANRRPVLIFLLLLTTAAVGQIAQGEPTYKLLKKVAYSEVDGDQLMLEVIVPTGKTNGLGIIDVASGAGYAGRSGISDVDRAGSRTYFAGAATRSSSCGPGPPLNTAWSSWQITCKKRSSSSKKMLTNIRSMRIIWGF